MVKTPKVCDLCGGSESEGRPMLSVGGANICFQCVEGLAYHMFKSDMGDIAADRILALVRGTHPELLPEEPHDDSPVLEVETKKLDELPTPEQMHRMLDQYVIGQELAKRTLCVAVYNHYLRLRQPKTDDGTATTLMVTLEGADEDEVEGRRSRRATSCSPARRAPARPCWPRPSRASSTCPSASSTPPPSPRPATSAKTSRTSSCASFRRRT